MPDEALELPAYAKPDLWLDAEHALEYLTAPGDSEPYGAFFWHASAKSETGWCAGTVVWRERLPFATAAQCWQLVSQDPLTIAPSVLCGCGAHGFIRGGKWEGC